MGIAVENARLYEAKVRAERLAAVGQAIAGLGHCIKNILNGTIDCIKSTWRERK